MKDLKHAPRGMCGMEAPRVVERADEDYFAEARPDGSHETDVLSYHYRFTMGWCVFWIRYGP